MKTHFNIDVALVGYEFKVTYADTVLLTDAFLDVRVVYNAQVKNKTR